MKLRTPPPVKVLKKKTRDASQDELVLGAPSSTATKSKADDGKETEEKETRSATRRKAFDFVDTKTPERKRIPTSFTTPGMLISVSRNRFIY